MERVVRAEGENSLNGNSMDVTREISREIS